jgi:uncharacterized protein
MRSFQIILLIVFIILNILIFLGSYYSLKKIVVPKRQRMLKIWFPLFHLLVLILFFILYIYPFQPSRSGNYTFHLVFNIFLFSVFMFNLPMAIAGLCHVIFRRKKEPVLPYIGLLIAVPLAGAMLYGTVAGVSRIKVVTSDLTFSNLPAAFHDYRLAVFTDTHLGGMLNSKKMLSKAAMHINGAEPDMVLFAGDLVNNFAYETVGLEQVFREISRNRESYSILGNHDYGDYSRWTSDSLKKQNFEGILNSHEKKGFRLLRNEHEILVRGNDSIFIAGVENWGHPPFPQYADLEKATYNIPVDAFTILLTHDPAHWESVVKEQDDIELTISGHTHGMQWGIKIAGIPFSLAYLTRKNWGGLYRSGNSFLYVNTGLGTVGMPWRLDMPAEITIITLKRGEIN